VRTVLDSSVLAAAAAGAVRLKVKRQAFLSAVVAVADRVLAGEAKGLVASDPADDMVLAAAIGGHAAGSSAWTAISSISRRSRVYGSSAPATSSSS
jgi:hypothetical protein